MSNHNHNEQIRISGERRPLPRSAAVMQRSYTQPLPTLPKSPLHTGARQIIPSKPNLCFRMNSSPPTFNSGSKTIHNRTKNSLNGMRFVNRKKEEVERSSAWNVDQVEEINPFFPVERSHEVIEGMSPSEIAINVYNFLASQSIDAIYDDEEAIAYAKTPTGCNFRVQLFKPNHNFSGKRDGSVLVEVQRRSGCCVKFHALAMQILYAAKGCECPHHYAIDDHKQLKVPGCDLFEGASTSAHANLRQGTAY